MPAGTTASRRRKASGSARARCSLSPAGDNSRCARLPPATADGRTELQLTPIELLDRLSQLVTPPRLHKHRYCGVLAPNAALRGALTASAGPAGATLQLLEQARASMGLPAASPSESDPPSQLSNLRRAAARCWALLLVRIYECLPLRCPKCGEPMRIIAFVVPPNNSIGQEIGPIGEHPGILCSPRHNRNGRKADGVSGRHNQLDIAGNFD